MSGGGEGKRNRRQSKRESRDCSKWEAILKRENEREKERETAEWIGNTWYSVEEGVVTVMLVVGRTKRFASRFNQCRLPTSPYQADQPTGQPHF